VEKRQRAKVTSHQHAPQCLAPGLPPAKPLASRKLHSLFPLPYSPFAIRYSLLLAIRYSLLLAIRYSLLAARHSLFAIHYSLLLLAGCASYQLGPQNLYPAHIRTVHVPVFQSDSFRRGLGELLTEAVVKEIERRTPYKVAGPEAADSVLVGRILADDKSVLSENQFDEPRQLAFGLQVEITWTDAAGGAVLGSAAVPVTPLAAQITEAEVFIPEAGQSISTAQQEAIRDLARQIVNQMEAWW
jgi:hypothetical protein